MYRDVAPIAPHPYGGFIPQTDHPRWVSRRGTQGSGGRCRCLGRGTMHEQLTSIDGLLEQMVALGASDLHITVGSAPAFRIRGHIARADGFDAFTAEDTR